MVAVVVVVAGASDWQQGRLAALARDQEPDRIDFPAIRGSRIRPARRVVRLYIVVDKGNSITD